MEENFFVRMESNMKTRMSRIQKAPLVHLFSSVDIPDDLISLGQGIPFFNPPKQAIDAVNQGMSSPAVYRYSPDAGFLSLRHNIAQKFVQQYDVSIDQRQHIVVTAGANQAFMNAILSITIPDDEVIFFRPTYFNYVMGVQLSGCTPVICDTNERYHPNISDLKKKITERTKAVVTISPNNPTGAVYTADELEEINRICAEYDLFHISDEVYEYFVYDGVSHLTPLVFDEDIDHTIGLFSCSKTFGMSGFRIGYMVVPKRIYEDVIKAQDTIGICASSISQIGAEAVIHLGGDYVSRFIPVFKKNRELLKGFIKQMPTVGGHVLNGAYYCLLSYDSNILSWDLCRRLIEEYQVLVVPGSVFDTEYSLRLSYGNLKTEDFKKGLSKLKEGLCQIL